MGAIPNPPIDYTSKDYAAFRLDMLNSISTRMPEWTSRSPNDFGVVLIELFAYMGDILSYYGDRIANESFLETATLRQSVFNIAKMLDYTPKGNTAATVRLTFTTEGSSNVTIPKGTQVSTPFSLQQNSAPVYFETDAAITINAGSTDGQVMATEGRTVGSPTREAVGTSNGKANQTFNLYQSPVIEGSVQVFVNEGTNVLWRRIDHLIDAKQNDAVYELRTNENGTVSIVFGDNVDGHIPVLGSPITATYRIGGGNRGNVGAGTLTQLVNSVPGVVAVTNQSEPTADNPSGGAFGGTDGESLDDIRVNAPKSLRALNRAVTTDDYATLALSAPGVAKATVVANSFSNILLYVAPVGGGAASTSIKTGVSSYVNPRKMIGTTVSVLDPSYVAINVSLTVQVLPNFNQENVRQTVENLIGRLFAFDNVSFGQVVTQSLIHRTIASVPGVDFTSISTLSKTTGVSDIYLLPFEIPKMGTVDVDADGGIIT